MMQPVWIGLLEMVRQWWLRFWTGRMIVRADSG